jgi:hypothetical protein
MSAEWFDVHAWAERYREQLARDVKAKLAAEAERRKREAETQLHRQVLAGNPAAMRQFVESIAERYGITIQWTARDWYACGKFASVPPPVDTSALAICLHELSHAVLGPCPGVGAHQPQQNGRSVACLECERLAWEKSTQLLPMDRAMHERLRSALATYRRSTPAPRNVTDSADRLMGSVRQKSEQQRRAKWQDKVEKVARWKQGIARRAK